MYQTLYIVPAFSDVAGQCRIVACDSDHKVKSARDSYRKNPEAWKEVGLMSSRGTLRCITAEPEIVSELKDCEPLMAGMVFEFNLPELTHA